MLAIYKYNLFKYVKAPSTWVIFAISWFIAGFLGGYLPYSSLSTTSDNAAENYSRTVISIVAGMTTFLSLFVSVFAGFKAATMFKDEVEDGTFLVTLSKPITRGKIIFGKWLALQTFLILFTLSSALLFGIFTYAFDNGGQISTLAKFGVDTIKSKIVHVTLMLWAIITLMGLIFSSIALLISTKFSVGTTIGISIAIGVIIPITSLLTTFTKKEEYTQLGAWGKDVLTTRFKKMNQLARDKGLQVDSAQVDQDMANFEQELQNPNSIYSLGLATGEKDDFAKSWFVDLDFQLHKLAEYSSEEVVPQSVKESIMNGQTGFGSFGGEGVSNKKVESSPISQDNNNDYNTIIDYLHNHMKFIWDFMTHELRLSWNIAQQLFVGGSFSIPENSTMPSNLANSIITHFGHTGTVSDLDTLKRIWNEDHTTLLNTTGAERSPLGYKNIAMPSDTDLPNQWWVPWYKLEEEIQKYRDAHKGEKDFVDRVQYHSWFAAMNAIYAGDNNIAGEVISLNDLNGYKTSSIGGTTKVHEANKLAISNLYTHWPRTLIGLGKEKEAQALASFSVIIQITQRPICEFMFDYSKLIKLTNQYGVSALKDNEATRTELQNRIGDYNFSANDRKALYLMLSLAKEKPELLYSIKAKDYVKKNSILIVYLSIALFLVPVSYWIVRKKDFR